MRKPNIRLLLVLPLLAFLFSFSTATAQAYYAPLAQDDFLLSVENLTQPTPTTIEFDVYLKDTDPSQTFEMASIQLGFLLNSGIYAGGTLAATYNNTGSGLSVPQQFTANTSIVTTINGYPGQTLIRLAGKTPPGAGNGTIISTTGFGTLVTHFTLTSSVPFTENSLANLTFTSSTSTTPLYATRVAQYQYDVNPAGTNVQLLVTAGVNALVCCNPVLNPAVTCVDPTTFTVTGGGSYCAGDVGVPVGLDGSQPGVNYTLNPGAVVVAGTGAAITFGNQLAGTYTVTALSDGSNTGLCLEPVLMAGGADVTETPVSTVEFTESACDTYTWALNGETYTVSGDYTFVVGCVTNILHLTITPSSTVEFTESACDSYLWALNGETYTASGDYTYVVGCVTNILHLTITPSSTMEHTESACDSYTWALNGMTYTASGDYTYVDGCVTHILHLTITPSSTVEFTESACDSYIWAVNGVTYTESGDYTYVDGCVTNILHLTITPSSTVEFTAAACDSYTWELNGVTYTVSGDYTYVVGCVTNILHLTITPSGTNEYTVSACDSYTWAVNGETYTESGTYTFVNVCSTNILYLTITPSSTVEFTESACDLYTWDLNGMTYTESGDYTYVDGCVTNILHLTITPYVTIEHIVAACDSYTWDLNGMTYTESGSYVYSDGCTSHVLSLTITPSSIVEETVVADDSYTWAVNGVTYTESGTYTYVDGCVTYILYLTINIVVPCPDFSTWNGSVNNDWFNAANWTPASVPCATTAVTIPMATNYPTLTSTAVCASILVQDGASFIGTENLTVGDVTVQRNFPVPGYHFLSSPVHPITFGQVFPLNQMEVWAYNYDESTGDWVNQFIADPMNVGTGYSVLMNTPQVANFHAPFNNNPVALTLNKVNPSGDPNRVGWNLLGNPYPCSLQWDLIIRGASVDGAVYLWNGSNYISYAEGVGGATGGIIPPQNGFFVKTAFDGDFIIIPFASRVHSNVPFYKESITNLLSLEAEGNNYSDEAFIRFSDDASVAFDSQADAYKLMGIEAAPQLYSMVSNEILTINTLPMEGNEVVNLGFKCGVDGTYSLNASGMESFSSSTPILLEDVKLNTIQDLRLNPVYSFNYLTSDNENRFNLHFKAATGINDPANSGIFVYSYERTVVINNTTGLNGEVRIFDMTGREIKGANMSSTTETRIYLQVAVGTYIVKVTTAQGTVNQKVFIK